MIKIYGFSFGKHILRLFNTCQVVGLCFKFKINMTVLSVRKPFIKCIPTIHFILGKRIINFNL